MREVWTEIERRFADRPLPPPEEERNYWLPPAPDWLLNPHDKLSLTRTRWAEFYQSGELVWGMFYIANVVLWKPGEQNAPAGILYSFDPVIQQDLSLLEDIAYRLGVLRDPKHPVPPGMQDFAQLIRDDRGRRLQHPIHSALTFGRAVYHAPVMIYRSHLPTRKVVNQPFPLLVRRGPEQPCILVPSRYWPKRLSDAWLKSGGEEEDGAT